MNYSDHILVKPARNELQWSYFG